MRRTIKLAVTLALVTLLAASCGKEPTTGDGPDGGGGGGGGGDATGPGGTPAFEATSPDITLAPGQEVTYCYYFHTSNTAPVAVNKWVSDMTPGSHHLILFTGGNHADGLDMTNSCGLGTSTGLDQPIWVYASQTEHQEEDLPTDDGNGKPLAQMIQPNTPAQIQMHYLNATDQPVTAHVHVAAYALPTGTDFTQTDAYITYNNDISIPAHATNFTVTASCNVPAGVKFWTMSTHSHKQSVHTDVLDGSDMVFQSNDWEHPGAQTWASAPFFTFTQPQLTWECTYSNVGDNANSTVVAGASAQTNEMCMAVGYFFPSTGPKFGLVYGGTCYSL